MSTENKKMSGAKIIALTISIGLHAAVAYYLGSMALDYALPKGDVSSIEMNFDSPVGSQTTDVDVVETVETAPTPPPPPPPAAPEPTLAPPAPKAEPKPVVEKAIPTELPTKEAVAQDQQGQMPVPVATEIPEDTHKELMEEPKELEQPTPEPTPEVTQEPVPEIIPTPAPAPEPTPAPEAATQATETPHLGPSTATQQGYGTPVGGNSTENLIPYGSNRAHSYPYMARLRKLEGTAKVQYTVAPNGSVSEAKLLQSSGHAALDSEAVDVIKKWKFKPMKSEVTYEKEVVFRLKGEATSAPSQLRRTNQ